MEKNLFGNSPIPSVFTSNDDAIKNIMLLYNIDRFDLDCTYSKGVFWNNLPKPINKSDIIPQREGVIESCSTNMPFKDNSINSIMYDPPFIISSPSKKLEEYKKSSFIIHRRFSSFKDFEDLKTIYFKTLKEAMRILKDNGLIVFKCQDVVNGGLQYMTHVVVMNMAVSLGFYPLDLIILFSKNRVTNMKGKTQRHVRKHHCYFWVFKKAKNKINYSFEKK